MGMNIDEMLHGSRRRLRTQPEKILMDANGLRLWADYMDVRPGFTGRFDFIHKINIPCLFSVECSALDGSEPEKDGNSRMWCRPEGNESAEIGYETKRHEPTEMRGEPRRYEPARIRWEPSNVELCYSGNGVSLREHKFITMEDAAVSCMVWENCGDRPFTVRVTPGTADGTFETTYGKKLAARFFCNGEELRTERDLRKEEELHEERSLSEERDLCEERSLSEKRDIREERNLCREKNDRVGAALTWTLHPGQTLELCVAAQICLEEEKELMELGCERIRRDYREAGQALENQKRAYQEWFDRVPEFSSSDPVIDRTWAYRWYILRHNMMKPGIGRLKETYFCEGRSHKMTKEPYRPEGWEFSKLIPLSVPMHLLDLRWYGEKEYGTSILHVMRENQDENGEFRCAKVNWYGNPYANFFGWGVWQYYLVSGERAFAEEALPVVKKQVQAWRKSYGNEKDALLTQYTHQLTGMEYQPSYWYFHDYPANCRDEKTFTPVKRVDRNVYHYLNALAVSHLCAVCGDGEENSYRTLAEQIKREILEKMWDEETGYFYDLHYQTDEKAFVKNIVGVFPFFGGIAGENHKKCMETLLTDEFDTPCPFPSVSTKCPVFTGEGGWQGHFFKGRNGCIWNGPAWPFANSMVLDGMGQESQRSGHVWDEAFRKYFLKFTAMHYYGGDGELPYLVEHYNSLTGECISDDVDYSHSYYIDLVVKYVAGISVGEETITVDPVDIGLRYFSLKNLRVRGHLVDVIFETDAKEGTVTEEGLGENMKKCAADGIKKNAADEKGNFREAGTGDGIFRILVDGREAARRRGLGRLEVSLKEEEV